METSMAAPLFREFVEVVFENNQSKAAEALGCARSLVSRLCNGDRSVTPDMARRIEELSQGRFRKETFIWPPAKREVA